MGTTHGSGKMIKLSGAIVGLGRMGLTHLAILNTHPAVGELSVVDSSPLLGKIVGKQLGLKYFDNTGELFERARPDFLIVATPTISHSEIARAAIGKGIHVFVEKPLSLSATESASLAQLAASRGVVGQVGYVNRFNEIFQVVRDLIRSGDVGFVTHVSCEIRSPTVLKASESGWRSKA